MKVALVSDSDWRDAIPRVRGADLICLPHLSFCPYVASSRDRGGLEHAERPVSRSLRAAASLAGDAWLAASAYESEGEGVFYVTSYLAGPGGVVASSRQRSVEAAEGRFEQMFWSPGHEPVVVLALPCGPTLAVAGADVCSPATWTIAAATGVRVVVGGTSEPAERWERTQRTVSELAARRRLIALVVNRGDEPFAGGSAAFDATGTPLREVDGLFELPERAA